MFWLTQCKVCFEKSKVVLCLIGIAFQTCLLRLAGEAIKWSGRVFVCSVTLGKMSTTSTVLSEISVRGEYLILKMLVCFLIDLLFRHMFVCVQWPDRAFFSICQLYQFNPLKVASIFDEICYFCMDLVHQLIGRSLVYGLRGCRWCHPRGLRTDEVKFPIKNIYTYGT